MQGKRGGYSENAQGIDAEDPASVEVFEEEGALEATALEGIHEDQGCMNKKEQHAEQAERGRGCPADVLDMHSAAEMLCENKENSNGSQKVQIGGGALRHLSGSLSQSCRHGKCGLSREHLQQYSPE